MAFNDPYVSGPFRAGAREMQRRTPLIYLHGIVQGLYEPAWPVFIVENHPEALTFIVAIDDQVGAPTVWKFNDPAALPARRQYVTAVVRQRLHQRGFRQRVLRAYQQCCAICRLRHDELLEAAHILPDGHPLGESEGASTCRAPSTCSPIATSWRSATPSSAARAER